MNESIKALVRNCLVLMTLGLPSAGLADPPGGNWLQLHQLNQANRLELERMQEASAEQQPPAATARERETWQRLNRQQRLDQQSLQQSQQHQRLILDQRNRVTPTERSRRLEGLFRQQRFRQAQERQLQRFQLQQRLYTWPR